jgi:hypothetical protein
MSSLVNMSPVQIRSYPKPEFTIGATVAYSKKLVSLQYRFGFEQRALRRAWGLDPLSEDMQRQWRYNAVYGAMAGDSFVYMEIIYGLHLSENQTVLCTRPSVDYLDHVQKPLVLAKLYPSMDFEKISGYVRTYRDH